VLIIMVGMENVNRDRFRFDCAACGKRRKCILWRSIDLFYAGNGAIINCAKQSCKKAFHPECARRAKFFLDIVENESSQVKFYTKFLVYLYAKLYIILLQAYFVLY
jgi:hypothetical protein